MIDTTTTLRITSSKKIYVCVSVLLDRKPSTNAAARNVVVVSIMTGPAYSVP